MSKLIIQPQTSEFVAKHPATGNTNFGTKKEPVYGKFQLVGMNSSQFYDTIQLLASEKDKDDTAFGKKAIAGCIIGWEASKFYCDDDENNIEYSPEASIELIENSDNFWLVNQLREHIEDTSNFFSTNK